ncbi:Ca(2+)-dependent cysteine protease [Borealophlyctis nickersoniae]|nr:Ca(2+)-dependent cysteine protease [Borealophlyctis nickersoniae]
MFNKLAALAKDKVQDYVQQQQATAGQAQQPQSQPAGGYASADAGGYGAGGGYGGYGDQQPTHTAGGMAGAGGYGYGAGQQSSAAHEPFQSAPVESQSRPQQVPDAAPASASSAQQWGTYTSGGKRKALFIGINYFNTKAALKGCINDVHNVHKWLTSNYPFAPNECLIMTDDQQDPNKIPTRANILAAFRWLVQGAQPGDAFFLHYSGHGSQEKDTQGEEAEGLDETIVPLDYETNGQIHDDDINSILVHPLPKGCRLTAIFDCCHSGSIMDLPFTYTVDGNLDVVVRDNTKEMIQSGLRAGMALFKGDNATALSEAKQLFGMYLESKKQGATKTPVDDEARKKIMEAKGSQAFVVQFSGCRDDQTSADAHIENEATGAMSWALLQTLATNNNKMTYTDVLKQTRGLLQGKYKQVPQMSTAFQVDVGATMFSVI